MSLTIQQIEQQIAELQKTLDELKNPKLKVSRNFTGQYFEPYEGKTLRRMESDNVPIWELYVDTKKEWVLMNTRDLKYYEDLYEKHCISE